MTSPTIDIGCISNVFVRQMTFKNAGDTEQGHAHEFDHLTLLGAGSARVAVNGRVTEFKAPHMIFIKAGLVHKIEALEPDTVAYCIHALRTGSRVEDIMDPAIVPRGVDPRMAASRL